MPILYLTQTNAELKERLKEIRAAGPAFQLPEWLES